MGKKKKSVGVRTCTRLRKDSAVHPFITFHRNGINSIKKKNLTWAQAQKKYPRLNPFGDADKDGLINMFDCKPFDKKRQGKRHKKSSLTLKQRQQLATLRKVDMAKEIDKKSDLEKSMERLEKAKKEKSLLKDKNLAMQKDLIEKSGFKNLQAEQLIDFPERYVRKKLGRDFEINELLEKRKDEEIAKREKRLEKEIAKEKYRQSIPGKITGGVESFGKGTTNVLKSGLTKRYSPEARAMASKAKRGIFGVLDALTTSGGLIEDGAVSYTNVGPGGGLARVRQAASQKYGAGKVGRPKGSYKYGVPIQQIAAAERERKRQLALQQLLAKQKMNEMRYRQPPTSPQIPQSIPQNYPPQPQDYSNEGFITPELIQGYAPDDARPISGDQIPDYARIEQPPKQNPWGLRAKYRPNLAMNKFKTMSTNLLTSGKNLLSPNKKMVSVPTNSTNVGTTTASTLQNSNQQLEVPEDSSISYKYIK